MPFFFVQRSRDQAEVSGYSKCKLSLWLADLYGFFETDLKSGWNMLRKVWIQPKTGNQRIHWFTGLRHNFHSLNSSNLKYNDLS